MLKYSAIICACLLLTGCNEGITYDSGTGGVIQQHFSLRDYGSVMRQTQRYCQQHGLGAPQVQQLSVGCLLCGSEFDQYQFTCSDK